MTASSTDIAALRKRLREELKTYLARPHRTPLHQPASKKELLKIFRASRGGLVNGWDLLNALDKAKPKTKVNASALKGALRDQLSPRQANRCCYCRRWMTNSGHARHIEHILPHSEFPQFSVHFWNLAIACPDCNSLKTNTIWGGINKKRKRYPLPSDIKTWFHPRFHDYDHHVRFVRLESNGMAVVVFIGLTAPGQFLCDNLLRHIAKMELLVASNPVLSGYAAALQDYQDNQDHAASAKGEALRNFQAQLTRSIVGLASAN
ncbi:HNH endonuclease domain-containing protein [Rhodoferax saidenbachensis]|uniref:Uncharacterized protein (TIGR02646 family) n=1 Tax=Rhodoferax saidenbachensis TaxID=1484693 RepID=A0ABU1ZTH0_9BURK|nr:HNH endonuclease domain-containing protein [Rhodoferax saidenbachensis]MDR7308231.1 uncharacterized protein (TIGR02646 family) [Rhodoferax saidenbachensis]